MFHFGWLILLCGQTFVVSNLPSWWYFCYRSRKWAKTGYKSYIIELITLSWNCMFDQVYEGRDWVRLIQCHFLNIKRSRNTSISKMLILNCSYCLQTIWWENESFNNSQVCKSLQQRIFKSRPGLRSSSACDHIAPSSGGYPYGTRFP